MEVLGAACPGEEGEPMTLIRLELHEHPAPPHREIRQKTIFDSGDRSLGTVANLYVDENSRQLRFVDVVTSDFLGLQRKRHLLPVEAVREEDPGWIILGVDQDTVERADLLEPALRSGTARVRGIRPSRKRVRLSRFHRYPPVKKKRNEQTQTRTWTQT